MLVRLLWQSVIHVICYLLVWWLDYLNIRVVYFQIYFNFNFLGFNEFSCTASTFYIVKTIHLTVNYMIGRPFLVKKHINLKRYSGMTNLENNKFSPKRNIQRNFSVTLDNLKDKWFCKEQFNRCSFEGTPSSWRMVYISG